MIRVAQAAGHDDAVGNRTASVTTKRKNTSLVRSSWRETLWNSTQLPTRDRIALPFARPPGRSKSNLVNPLLQQPDRKALAVSSRERPETWWISYLGDQLNVHLHSCAVLATIAWFFWPPRLRAIAPRAVPAGVPSTGFRRSTRNTVCVAYLSATDCAAVGRPPNHAGCFTMVAIPITASSKQMMLICNSR